MKQKIFSKFVNYCKNLMKNLAPKEEEKKQGLTTDVVLTTPIIPEPVTEPSVIVNPMSFVKTSALLPQVMPSTFYIGTNVGFVIDVSLAGITNIRSVLSEICHLKNANIIMTSVTIKELDKLQHFVNYQGLDARQILSMAAENKSSFKNVSIDETIGTHDDCIISYCSQNKDWIILLTADIDMALKAEELGVKAVFFNHSKPTQNSNQPNTYYKSSTLFASRFLNGNLTISCFDSTKRSIRVLSSNIEYKNCELELQIGDYVFVASRKSDYLSFAHYEITSLSANNNCKLVFVARLYNTYQIRNLPKAAYKSFMLDFQHIQGT